MAGQIQTKTIATRSMVLRVTRIPVSRPPLAVWKRAYA
jgi:hypothetical protein